MKTTKRAWRSKAGFADLYLERYGSGPVEGLPEPDPDLFLVVIIPAYKEPDLAASVQALLACDGPWVKWEIIVNINYPENSGPEVVQTSRQSLAELERIQARLQRDDVRILALWNPDVPGRHAGVGLARKLAMDEAIRRLNSVGRPDGVIISFDADSVCESNFLSTVAHFYLHHPHARTANIRFEHPLGGDADARLYRSIAQYELYLRYMRIAISQTGHPHSIHTVGSCFSLRAKTYIRVNGMGRDKAGEDFYFLHKCILLGGFWEINETVVSPSVRESDRVVFGTGASVQRLLQNEDALMVYDLNSFEPLGQLFEKAAGWWDTISSERQMEEDWQGFSPALAEFLISRKANLAIERMFRDSAGPDSFMDKFFAWFNVFMILRYLNESHKTHYSKSPVILEADNLAFRSGMNQSQTAEGLLEIYRDFERSRGNYKVI